MTLSSSSSTAPAAPAGDAVPLTPLQQGMYFTWLQNPAAGIDMEQMVCHLPEAVDASRLRQAWETLTAVHPILRTTFEADGATTHAVLPFPWQELEWSMEGDASRLAGFLDDDRRTPLHLTEGPLQRLTLIRSGPDDFRLIWTFHHILLDGRAITALLQQVFALYDDPAARLPARPSWQEHNRWLQAHDPTPSASFWQNHLTGIQGPTPLVVDHIVPLGHSTTPLPAQEEADLQLAVSLTDDLRNFAAGHGLTLNILVQGAFALLLGRYAGEDQVIFGATRACRHTPVPDSQKIIGLLINTLPVKVDIPAQQALLPWLKSLRQLWLDLRPHEHTPLSFIRRVCGLSPSQAPFNHLLVFENDDYTGTLRASGGPAFSKRSFHLRELTSVPLTVAVYGSTALHLHCAWQPARFDRETIQRLLGHLAFLLEQFAAASPDTLLSTFTLTTPAERQFLLHDCQPDNPGFPSDTTLHSWLAETAAKFPGRTAVTAGETHWTYAELERRSTNIARALITCGVRPGDIVGLCMDRHALLTASLLGILKAGAAYLPIDLAYPQERLAFMLEDARASLLLTERSLAPRIPGNPAATLFIEDINGLVEAPAGPSVCSQPSTLNPQLPQTSPDSLAYVIYTSGSTGLPKGCQITHRNVVRLMKATEPWYGFDENDVWTLFHSTAFDFSVWELWGALLYGGRLVVVPWLTTRSPDDFFQLLCEERVTVLNQTPSAFRQLIKAELPARTAHPGLPPHRLRYIIFGGESLEMKSLKPWYDRHGDTAPVLVNMYGITETTVHVTYRPLSSADLDRGPVIGTPIPDLQLYILDPLNRQPVPLGVPGEMYVGGAGLAAGYLHRDELTAERFIPNHLTGKGRLYKTGDLGRFLPVARPVPALSRASAAPLPIAPSRPNLPPESPYPPKHNPFLENKAGTDLATPDIEYLGRIDYQVKIRGFRIEPGEIENILTSHPAVLEAAVLAREDRPGDKRLCAYLVPAPTLTNHLSSNLNHKSPPPSPDDLRALLRSRVPDYMVPAAFVYLEKFPVTANGKLDRKALPAPAADGPATARPFQAPSTPAETLLASIWAAVLRLDRVSATDHFFETGGDSILSIQVIARAREAGLGLTPRQLFEHPVLADLAAVATPLPALSSVTAHDPTSPFPLAPVQGWFFEQKLAGSHHWNQSFLFTLTERLDPGLLERALHSVVRHHPALRLRFHPENHSWNPAIAPEETADLLVVYPSLENLEARCARLQTTLDYQTGPLLRAALFDAGQDRPGRLCLAVHHLAIDGVSWRILLEDLETALSGRALPASTTPWPAWVRHAALWPSTPAARHQLSFWQAQRPPMRPGAEALTLERDTVACTIRLTEQETTALLQQAPAAWHTRINDLLLTALAIAHGKPVLTLNLEGHGREEFLAPGLPVDRTIGWFTSLFPVRLELPSHHPETAIPSIKEQLRAIPGHGAGYPFLLPLLEEAAGSGPANPASPCPMVFNYLGQFDALTAGSRLFRFAPEATGPWHSPEATRAHATEINAMVVHGCLQTTFTSALPVHTKETLTSFAQAFAAALRKVISHCLGCAAPRFTPSDFPLADLPQDALNLQLASAPEITDICRLSPMQQLFYNAALTKPNAGFDQWHCRHRGPLDAAALESAWSRVVARHSILRSTFHSAGLPHAVMVVHLNPTPSFTRLDADGPDAIIRLLASDAAQVNDLTKPPCSRFTLLRLSAEDHFFLWSVPDLQLDGWSWPIAFGEAAALYRSLTAGTVPGLPCPLPYRDYLHWLRQQDPAASDAFWQSTLASLTHPTPLPVETLPGPRSPRRSIQTKLTLPAGATRVITAAARRLGITPGVLAQGAWAALLGHAAGKPEVVYGSAFSGRPTDLPGAGKMVGPFVNNLPVRTVTDPAQPVTAFLRQLHAHLTDLTAHQFTPLPRIQDQSGIPWRFRLFDSLLVFQNYQVDPRLTRLGPETTLTDFCGPVHTNFPLTLVVTPRGGPASSGDAPASTVAPNAEEAPPPWDLLLVHQEAACSTTRAQQILSAFSDLLQSFAACPEQPLGLHFGALALPSGCSPAPESASPATPASPPFCAPRTPMEHRLARIWQRAFGLTVISTTDNFFALGGHSLLMLRVHQAICQELARPLPVVALFQYPTIATLAAYLDPSRAPAPGTTSNVLQNRAAAARAAVQRAAAARR